MAETLNILLLEDSDDDALLVERELAKSPELAITLHRSRNREEYEQALKTGEWDAVLSDYMLPDIEAPEALTLLTAAGRDIPFIVMSGQVGEETAVAVMRMGASDYVMKDRLTRLPAALGHAIQEDRKRREAAEQLRASEARYQVLFNRVNDAVFLHPYQSRGKPGNFVDVNDIACDRLGYTREELLQMGPMDLDAEDSFDNFLAVREEFEASGQIIFETVHEAKDGTRFPVELSALLFHDLGEPMVLTVARDLTRRKQDRKSLEWHSQILRAVKQAVIVTDLTGAITFWNEAARELFGWTSEEVLDRPIVEVTPAVSEMEQAAGLMERLSQGESWSGEIQLQTRSGRVFDAVVTNSPLFNEEGKLTGVVGITTDVSRLKRQQREIRKLSWAVVQSPIGIAILDNDRRIEYANPSFLAITGLDYSEIKGKRPNILDPASYDTDFCQELDELLDDNRTVTRTFHHHRPDGEEYWAESTFSPIQDEEGERTNYLWTKVDLTEQRQLEQENTRLESELSRQFHLTQVGLLASGITHNIRSPLTAAQMGVDLLYTSLEEILNEKPEDPLPYFEFLEEVENKLLSLGKSLKRIHQVVDDLAAYHSMNRRGEERCDINQVLQADTQLLAADMDFKHRIEIRLELEPGSILVRMRTSDVSQIFLNLASNARDALLETEDRTMTLRSGSEEERGIGWFEVRDSGPGVPEEIQDRLGDPFFTTKAEDEEARKRGSGTGLGLFMIQRILNRAGGSLELQSEPGDTRFRVNMPLSSKNPEMLDVQPEEE